jgi:hypothetical protein
MWGCGDVGVWDMGYMGYGINVYMTYVYTQHTIPAMGYGLWAMGYEVCAMGYGLWAMGSA